MNIDKIGLQEKKVTKSTYKATGSRKNLKKKLHKVQDCNNKNFE